MVVLDTDHVSLLERADSREGERLRQRLKAVPPAEQATTIITYEEQTRGWLAFAAKAQKQSLAKQLDAYRRLRQHLDAYCRMLVLPFDERAAVEWQRLRGACPRAGPMDLKIAAIVVAHGATLLSRNLPHFGKVPELKVEDWTS